jgi:hypothetical protein
LHQVQIDRDAIERKVMAQIGEWRTMLKDNGRT